MPDEPRTHPEGDCHAANGLTISGGGHYEITVKGHIDEQWADWFGELSISHDECGLTTLSGMIVDQAALHGVLAQIRDLGLTLISFSLNVRGNAGEE